MIERGVRRARSDSWVMVARVVSLEANEDLPFRAMYRTTVGEVYGYVMGLTGGDRTLTEDLVTEAYMAAVDRFADGRESEVTVPWLKVVAKRRFVDHVRRETSVQRRVERLKNELTAGAGRSARDAVDEIASRQEVYDALSQLSADQRLVLVMRHVDGFSTREIAEHLGRSPKAVESLLARARAAFREVYEVLA